MTNSRWHRQRSPRFCLLAHTGGRRLTTDLRWSATARATRGRFAKEVSVCSHRYPQRPIIDGVHRAPFFHATGKGAPNASATVLSAFCVHLRTNYHYLSKLPSVTKVPPRDSGSSTLPPKIVQDGRPHFWYRQEPIPDGGEAGPFRLQYLVLRRVSVPQGAQTLRRNRRALRALSSFSHPVCFSPQWIAVSLNKH